MRAFTIASKLKSGSALVVLFPLITFVVLTAVEPVPILGRFVSMIAYFSAPFLWLLAIVGDLNALSKLQTTVALWLHYPILGFVSGYLWPFELGLSRTCAKHVAVRYVLFVLCIAALGIGLGLYAAFHDS